MNKNKNKLTQNHYFTLVILLGCMIYSYLEPSTAAAGSLPWETPMETLRDSLTNTVAKAICAIVVCVTGVMISMGEGGAAGRVALRLVFGLALAIGFLQILDMF